MGVYLPIKDYSAMQGPCPDGFHIPNKDEWQSVYNVGVSLGIWSSSSGDNMKVYLKLPYAGYIRYSDGYKTNSGSYGHYWSVSAYGTNSAYYLNIGADNIGPQWSWYRASGYSIRPFKDIPVTPDSSWTSLYSDKIYHNSVLGLISLSSDGNTRTTIADKNLGATTVYNNGDTLTQNNCGKFFQRGNNYNFNWSDASSTSTIQANASGYGPGNYYSDSHFRKGYYDRSSVQNDNLWGGETGVKPMSELKNAYIGDASIDTPGIYHNPDLGLISLSRDGLTRITYKDKNIGAITYDVTSTDSYGDYYSWGAKQNRNGQSASGYTMQEDWSLGNQTIAPSGYHIPTQDEWTRLVYSLNCVLETSSLNYNQARQYLLLPRSGQMTDSGTTIQYAETSGGGYYWSSTKSTSTSAYILRSTSSLLNATGSAVTFPRGFSVRLWKDTPVEPDSGWNTILAGNELLSYYQIMNIYNTAGNYSLEWSLYCINILNQHPVDYYNKYSSEGYMEVYSGDDYNIINTDCVYSTSGQRWVQGA